MRDRRDQDGEPHVVTGNGPGSCLAFGHVAYGEYDMGTGFGERPRRGSPMPLLAPVTMTRSVRPAMAGQLRSTELWS
mgnify:CR=1 FL=1